MSQNVVKIKPKKEYEWQQDQKFVYIRLNLPHTTIKRIEIFLSDLVLRVTSLERKSTHVFDLYHPVNYKSKETRNVYANGILEITLVKEVEGMWPDLLVDVPIQQLKERRKESQKRYEQTQHDVEQKKEQLRDQYDRKATQELMRFEQEQRDKLEQRKKQEKERALEEVYTGFNEQGKIVKPPIQGSEIWDQKQKLAIELLEKQQQEDEIKRQELKKLSKVLSVQRKEQKSMFTEEQIEAAQAYALKNSEQFEEIPVRKADNVTLKFTEKIYPHVATRDTHYLDPPAPKNKNAIKGQKGQSLQQRSPLWLKDRGDDLIKNKDYISAVNAYDQAIKLDDKFMPAYLNRSYCHLKLFNFNECISDCESVIKIMQGMIGGTETAEKSSRMLAKVGLRKAVCMAWRGEIDEAKAHIRQTLESFREVLEDKDVLQIEEAIKAMERREESNEKKCQADLEYKKNNFQKSVDIYDQSIRIDNNEYSLSNKALVLLKLNRSKDVIECCDKGLQQIERLTQHANISSTNSANSNYQSSKLVIKLILRKAAALKLLGKFNEGLEVLRPAMALDDQDKECKALYKEMEIQCNKQIVKGLKQEAAQYLKSGKMEQALEKYNECLKLLDASETLQYLAILQNRCVCYLKLERYDDIVATAIRSLKMIHNQQNRLVAFDNSKIANKQQKQKLTEFEVRILMRRANAYLNLGQSYNAKSDLEKAQQLAPDNQSIKVELEKVVAALKK